MLKLQKFSLNPSFKSWMLPMWLWPLSGGPEKRFETKKRRPLILDGAIMGNYKQQFVSRLFRSMFGCTFWSWANHGEQRQWNWLFLVAGRTKTFGKSKRYRWVSSTILRIWGHEWGALVRAPRNCKSSILFGRNLKMLFLWPENVPWIALKGWILSTEKG